MILHEYEVKIRTEKHGVYYDHGPFIVQAKNKYKAITVALRHLTIRIQKLYQNKNKYKVTAWKNIIEDSVGSEVSIIVTRLQ